MLRAVLTLDGHDVREARNATEGLSAAAGATLDVAIVDICLPDSDGYEVASRLRAGANGSRMILIALSGYGREDHHGRSWKAGFDAHLVKPSARSA